MIEVIKENIIIIVTFVSFIVYSIVVDIINLI